MSESSAARLRPRGGRQTGKNFGAGTFATLDKRGPSRRFSFGSLKSGPLRQMARPVWPSRRPTSTFCVAFDQKRQILSPVVTPYSVAKGTITSYCRRLSSFDPLLCSKPYYHLLVRLYCAQLLENHYK